MNKNFKIQVIKETIDTGGATATADVQGIQTVITDKKKKKGKGDKIVRRPIGNFTVNIGEIKL